MGRSEECRRHAGRSTARVRTGRSRSYRRDFGCWLPQTSTAAIGGPRMQQRARPWSSAASSSSIRPSARASGSSPRWRPPAATPSPAINRRRGNRDRYDNWPRLLPRASRARTRTPRASPRADSSRDRDSREGVGATRARRQPRGQRDPRMGSRRGARTQWERPGGASRPRSRGKTMPPAMAGEQALIERRHGIVNSDSTFQASFTQALALHDTDHFPLERARTELVYGERLRRAGKVREARRQLRRALLVFDELGQEPGRLARAPSSPQAANGSAPPPPRARRSRRASCKSRSRSPKARPTRRSRQPSTSHPRPSSTTSPACIESLVCARGSSSYVGSYAPISVPEDHEPLP
jgi:hypothetical protein